MRRTLIVAALATAAALPAARAADYPSKPITIVVPATPGGAIDQAARLIGAKLTAAWGQPVTIDNRGGAAGILGSELVAKAAPDGHVLALVASSHAINPSLYRKLPYDTQKAFEPVALTHVVPLLLAVNDAVPAKTLPELIAHLKSNPGRYAYASSGNGGAPHMSAELFRSMAGVDLVHVPYKGSTAAHPDLIAGRTALMFDTVAAIAGQVRAGTVRGIAVTTAKRSGVFPDLPTMAEAGLPGYDTSTWGGLLAPAGTPRDVIAKLNAEVVRALASPDVREKLLAAGIEPGGGTPQQFAAFVDAEIARWAAVAKAAGVQPE